MADEKLNNEYLRSVGMEPPIANTSNVQAQNISKSIPVAGDDYLLIFLFFCGIQLQLLAAIFDFHYNSRFHHRPSKLASLPKFILLIRVLTVPVAQQVDNGSSHVNQAQVDPPEYNADETGDRYSAKLPAGAGAAPAEYAD